MAKGKAYYAMSMVVTRLTGIPYRQNDVTVNARNGRVLIRSESAERIRLTEECFAMLAEPTKKGLVIEVWQDPAGVLGQHVRKVSGQSNMQFYSRDMARRWAAALGKEEMRMRVTAVFQKSEVHRLVTLEEVQDMASKYRWKTRTRKI